MKILQVNTYDTIGGAALIAWHLFKAYRSYGHDSWLVVKDKKSSDPDVFILDHGSLGPWFSICKTASQFLSRLKICGIHRLSGLILNYLMNPLKTWNVFLGHEDFYFPNTKNILKLIPQKPDILHCHNLHGFYFDLRELARLSHEVPTILTLHDEWTLTGHCAYTIDCKRFQMECGKCPNLSIYPAIKRDATRYNWKRKEKIYKKSRLFIATSSKWLMSQVQKSMLLSAAVELKVINDGVDISIFKPTSQSKTLLKSQFGIDKDTIVLLFIATDLKQNPFKDFKTLYEMIQIFSHKEMKKNILLLCIGDVGEIEHFGERVEIRFIPHISDHLLLSSYYQLADMYVHAAHSDNFPNAVLKALACGTPVIATAVGGIPEQVKSLDKCDNFPAYSPNEATGVLVPPKNPQVFSDAVYRLISDQSLMDMLSHNAAQDASKRFSLDRQVNEYLNWYEEIMQF